MDRKTYLLGIAMRSMMETFKTDTRITRRKDFKKELGEGIACRAFDMAEAMMEEGKKRKF